MPPFVGDRLVKDSSRRIFQDAISQVRRSLYNTSRGTADDVERSVGKVLEDVLVRSEGLEEALVRSQAENALSGQQLRTVREGIRGLVQDNRNRIADWEHTIRPRDRAAREDFLWKTWDWLSQSLTWLQNKAG